MATRQDDRNLLSQLESVRTEIIIKFSRAHRLLQEREAALLLQLQEIEQSYIVKERDARIDKQRKELLASKENLQSTMKGNENLEILEAMLAPLEEKLKELEIRDERIVFEWDTDLESKLADVGNILLEDIIQPISKNRGEPVLVACTYNKYATLPGEFKYPTDISVDSTTGNIYICDESNHRIQVFNSSCEFLFLFSEHMKNPSGVTIYNKKVYTTQNSAHSLCVYSIDGKYLQSFGKMGVKESQFKNPLGLCIDDNRNLIYICDQGNDRIQVFNLQLLTFNSSIQGLEGPKDINIANQEMFVLDKSNPCLHVYNREHQLVREFITRGFTYSQVQNPYHFVIDDNLNILFTDGSAGLVLKFTKEGNLVDKIAKKEELKQPRGIAIDSIGRIIVACQNPQQCIQFF